MSMTMAHLIQGDLERAEAEILDLLNFIAAVEEGMIADHDPRAPIVTRQLTRSLEKHGWRRDGRGGVTR